MVRPPLNKKVFPVHRPSGLKRANWKIFFIFFEKKVSSKHSVYPSQYKLKIGKKNPDLMAGFFLCHPVDRKRFFSKGWPENGRKSHCELYFESSVLSEGYFRDLLVYQEKGARPGSEPWGVRGTREK